MGRVIPFNRPQTQPRCRSGALIVRGWDEKLHESEFLGQSTRIADVPSARNARRRLLTRGAVNRVYSRALCAVQIPCGMQRSMARDFTLVPAGALIELRRGAPTV